MSQYESICLNMSHIESLSCRVIRVYAESTGLGPPVPSEPATFSGGQMAAGALVMWCTIKGQLIDIPSGNDQHSYGKSSFIVDLPIINCDFP